MLVSLGLPWLPMPLTNTSPSILTHTCAAVFVLDLVAGVVARSSDAAGLGSSASQEPRTLCSSPAAGCSGDAGNRRAPWTSRRHILRLAKAPRATRGSAFGGVVSAQSMSRQAPATRREIGLDTRHHRIGTADHNWSPEAAIIAVQEPRPRLHFTARPSGAPERTPPPEPRRAVGRRCAPRCAAPSDPPGTPG